MRQVWANLAGRVSPAGRAAMVPKGAPVAQGQVADPEVEAVPVAQGQVAGPGVGAVVQEVVLAEEVDQVVPEEEHNTSVLLPHAGFIRDNCH